MKLLIRITLALLVLSLSAFSETPTDLTKQYFANFKAGNYVEVAKMIDPSELKAFREGFKFAEELPAEKAAHFATAFFGNEATAESIKKMSDVQFYSSFLTSTLKMMGGGKEVKFENEQILGEEIEEEKMASVKTSYRILVGEQAAEESEVISFRKGKEGWLMLLPESMKGLPASLKVTFQQ